jgi:tight adherence protein B
VFSVGLNSPAFKPAPLQTLASTTGGDYVQANSPSALQPILTALARSLSNEYLLSYRSRANPSTQVAVSVSVKGLGVARSAYTTPALKLPTFTPYTKSTTDKIIQSYYTMAVIAVLFAVLLGFSVAYIARGRPDPLVERVGDFVAVQRDAGEKSSKTREPIFRRPAFLTRTGSGKDVKENGWYQRLGAALELADIDAGPFQAVVFVLIATFFVILLLLLIVGPLGILFGLATPLVARAIVVHRIDRKRRVFAEQLPDNLDVLASSLRAGHSLVSALTVVADDANEPSKSEFQRVLAEEQFGVQLEDAFKVVVDRMENNDLDQVALVARLQREMGSNSAEVLDRVIETVRARMELRRLVRTLTAQGRLSRWILTLLPIGLALVLSIMSKGYMHPLFHETLGKFLLVLAACMVAFGSYVIGKIIDIRV